MFASLRNNAIPRRQRAFSGQSLATGAVIAGGYYYTRSKQTADIAEVSSAPVTTALDPKNFTKFTLREVQPINHDTALYRFALGENQELGLNVTSCLVVKAKIGDDEKPTIRPYTPTSAKHARGHFDLVVKTYEAGKMSKHIHTLKPGDTIEMKGPIPKYPYKANALKEIGMVAGGSGITPMLQFIEQITNDPEDKTKLTLVFANKSEEDIILRSTLDEYARKHPDQLKVHYVIDKATSADWKGETGFVTKELVQKYLPAPSEGNVLVVACGPPPMMKAVSGPKAPDYSQGEVGGIFKELGYSSEQVFKF
ncbi:cytochrome-b5 reductase [Linderina pennispora]|uniref:NADH-cytochrome b5 reductase n=1 Tax=Linderina pennispora TaxID=61395 RepID=A0A1Y1W583_9FUNG|nr:cytochrome-b5 reductase [Linderina pennispora]ORX68699.1 cytochrome-b5 reductase [Linderina pennispora]